MNALLIQMKRGGFTLVQGLLAGVGEDILPLKLEVCGVFEEGLQRLSQGDFSIVIVDLDIPGCNGLEAVHEVRRRAPAAAVVVLSSVDDDAFAWQAVRQGAEDFLHKKELNRTLMIRSLRYAYERQRMAVERSRTLSDLRLVIEKNSEGMLILGADGRVLFANPEALRLFKSMPDVLIGSGLDGRIRALPDGQTVEVWAEGQMHALAELRRAALTWEQQPATLLSLRDITQQKEAEARLRQSEERYRGISELVSDYAYSFRIGSDGKAHVEWVTDSFQRITGYTLEEALELGGWRYLLHPEDVPKMGRLRERAFNGDPGADEVRIYTRSGEMRWLRHHSQVVRDPENHAPMVFYGGGQDITDRKLAEDAYQALVDQSPQEMVILQAGRVVFANQAAIVRARLFREDVSQISADEILARLDLPLDARVDIFRQALDLLDGGHHLRRELWVSRSFGEGSEPEAEADEPPSRRKAFLAPNEAWVELVVMPIDYQGRPALQISLSDVSERKRAEQLEQTLYRISETVNLVENLDQLYFAVHTIVSDLIPADNFYIALLDDENGQIYFPYFVDEFDNTPEPQRIRRGLTEYVLRSGRPLLATPEIFDQLVAAGEVEQKGADSVDWLGVPLRRGDGKILGALVVQTYQHNLRYTERDQDILTFVSRQIALVIERKRTEEMLRDSEEHYRTLVENIPVGVYRTTPGTEGSFLTTNPALRQMFGFRNEEEARQVHTCDLYAHPQERKAFSDRMLAEGAVTGVELLLRRQDGSTFWGLVNAKVLYDDETGLPVCFDCTLQDITERKLGQRQRESLAAMAFALRETPTRAETLTTLLDEILVLIEADIVAVALLDAFSSEVVIELARGAQAERLTGVRMPLNESTIGNVILTGKAYLSNQVQADAARMLLPEAAAEMRAVALVPLLAEGNPIGALFIGGRHTVRGEDFQLLRAIADLAASAIQRATLAEQTESRLQRLSLLRTISATISATPDLNQTLDALMEQIVSQGQADAADILLYEPEAGLLRYAAGTGFRDPSFQNVALRLGQGEGGRAVLERRTVQIPDLLRADGHLQEPIWIEVENFRSYYAVPLIVKNSIKGVLETFHRQRQLPTPEWTEFLESLARQVALALDRSELIQSLMHSNEELSEAYQATIQGWSAALDLRDKETQGHSLRVANWTLRLSRAIGVTEEELSPIWRGALLHDIGKMAIADSVLLKQGMLSTMEWEIMRQHPVYAYQLLRPITFLQSALDIPHYHHEHWDGSGYPEGLAGEAIPLAARIISVVAVWDALRSDRPYRPAWPEEKVIEYIREQSGKHFDPRVVNIFLELLEQRAFTEEDGPDPQMMADPLALLTKIL